jgi:hypothetical protein
MNSHFGANLIADCAFSLNKTLHLVKLIQDRLLLVLLKSEISCGKWHLRSRGQRVLRMLARVYSIIQKTVFQSPMFTFHEGPDIGCHLRELC